MRTIQSAGSARRATVEKKEKAPALASNPQKARRCTRVYTATPKKPNSALRSDSARAADERIRGDGHIPGEGPTSEHRSVLIRGARGEGPAGGALSHHPRDAGRTRA